MNAFAVFCGKFKYLGIFFLIKFTKYRFFGYLIYDFCPKLLYVCLQDKTAIFDINAQSQGKY